jgi:outer membrane protein, heavy metal efflux system
VNHRLHAAGALLALAAVELPGCVHFRARPLSPEDTLAAFSARSLDDPGLAAFLRANKETVPGPGSPWGLRRLVLAAFYYHPDLDVARAELAKAEAAKITAGGRRNPAIALSAGFDSTTSRRVISPWILGFALDIPLRTAGKRGHLVARAGFLADAARLHLAGVAWQVRSRVRRSLLDLWAARQEEALLARGEEVQQDNASLLERQFEAGAVSEFEVTQARLARDAARIAHQDAAARIASVRVQLAGALGMPEGALAGVAISFAEVTSALPTIPAPEARRKAILNRADLLGALADYAAAQAELQFQIARQYPDIHLGPGYELDQSDNKWILAVSLPVPLLNRNKGPIAEAEARRRAAAARFVALQAQAVEEIDQAIAALRGARDAARTAEAMTADLEKREEAARARFDAGETSRLDLDQVRLEKVNSELSRLDALTRARSALGRLEDAMQVPAEPLEPVITQPVRRTAPAASGLTSHEPR